MLFLEITGFDCGGEAILSAIKFIMLLLDVVFVLVPIILIVLLMIDLLKAVISNDEGIMNRAKNIVLRRVIICVCLFLVGPITHVVINIAGDNNDTYLSCIKIALNEDLSQYKIEYTYDTSNSKEVNNSTTKSKYKVVSPNNTKTNTKSDKESSNTKAITGTFEIKNKKNLVGIFYSTWFDAIKSKNPKLISSGQCNNIEFCYWGKPALGFYNSSDKKVIKKHMKQLADANIDFIILDNTNMTPENLNINWNGYIKKPMTALLNTIVEMRKNGEKTPYVVNWIWTGNKPSSYGNIPFVSWESVNRIYKAFYENKKYKDVWVYWNNKPFIITTSSPTSSPKYKITTRSMWGLNGTSGVNWSYLEHDNDKPGRNKKGAVEQIGVSVAMQANYMSNTSSAKGRRGGWTFYEQWLTAFKYHPKIVTITWWNEWTAQNLNGKYTDLYNQEYSRDIEPMKGGHKDTYYKWMKKYIAAYKNNKKCPKLVK